MNNPAPIPETERLTSSPLQAYPMYMTPGLYACDPGYAVAGSGAVGAVSSTSLSFYLS